VAHDQSQRVPGDRVVAPDRIAVGQGPLSQRPSVADVTPPDTGNRSASDPVRQRASGNEIRPSVCPPAHRVRPQTPTPRRARRGHMAPGVGGTGCSGTALARGPVGTQLNRLQLLIRVGVLDLLEPFEINRRSSGVASRLDLARGPRRASFFVAHGWSPFLEVATTSYALPTGGITRTLTPAGLNARCTQVTTPTRRFLDRRLTAPNAEHDGRVPPSLCRGTRIGRSVTVRLTAVCVGLAIASALLAIAETWTVWMQFVIRQCSNRVVAAIGQLPQLELVALVCGSCYSVC